MPGRKQDRIWAEFERSQAGSGYKAKCNTCGATMQGIPARMKNHIEICRKTTQTTQQTDINEDDDIRIVPIGGAAQEPTTSASSQSKAQAARAQSPPPPPPIAKKRKTMDDYAVKTTVDKSAEIDTLIAKMVFATNSPFRMVEHPAFIAMISALRPGYTPPDRHRIGDELLDKVHSTLQADCKNHLEKQTVSMTLDGWSNVHNEPIVCVAVTDQKGISIVADSIDTSGHQHTSEYLHTIAEEAIRKVEADYGCTVGSFVTDNAANMAKMRRQLMTDESTSVVTYGCGAHILNLLAKDLEAPGVYSHVVAVAKYFRNKHLPAAWYKEAGGRKLPIPIEVRWNSVADTVKSYLDNWPILMAVCETHRNNIDKNISAKVKNIGIKRSCEDYLTKLQPIAASLDKMQSDTCTIADAVDIWIKLENEILDKLTNTEKRHFSTRKEMNITAQHLLAYALHPKYRGKFLNATDKEKALQHCSELAPDLLAVLVQHMMEEHDNNYRYTDAFVDNLSPVLWWQSMSTLTAPIKIIIMKYMTAIASSASVERVFSSFGLVHSKLRNRLGVVKAGKLVFIYKYLN